MRGGAARHFLGVLFLLVQVWSFYCTTIAGVRPTGACFQPTAARLRLGKPFLRFTANVWKNSAKRTLRPYNTRFQVMRFAKA
jgi:hypothetical protein